jgi:hypothetical protein
MSIKTFGLAVAVVALLTLPTGLVAHANTLYNNLGAGSADTDPVATFGPLADSFSTGVSAFTFNDLQLVLEASDPASGGSLTVSLLSDNASTPGSLVSILGTIDDSQLGTSLGVIDLSVGSIDLSANTRYWIELSSTDTTAEWSFSSDISGTGVGGEFFSNIAGVSGNSGDPYQMQVNGVLPEPMSIALFGTAVTGLGFVRRRRRG